MGRSWWGRGLILLAVAVAAMPGCGGDDGETAERAGQEPAQSAPQPGSNVPAGGKTIAAKVYEEDKKGVPADIGQWMVEIGVVPDGLAYTVGKVIVPPGNTNFRLDNPQGLGHDLVVERLGAAKGTWTRLENFDGERFHPYFVEVGNEELTGGAVKTVTVEKGSAWLRKSLFEDERYVFYCSVPGHREAGMEGTIVVDPKLRADDLKPY